jgi:protein CpxP
MRAVMHLDLSDEQENSIRGIMKSLKKNDRDLMKEMRSNQEQLKDLIKADTFDETAVADIAGKEGTLTTERLILASRAMSQVYALLTAEQREELSAMAAKRDARRAEKRARWSDDD